MLAWQSAQGAQFYVGCSVKVCASSAEIYYGCTTGSNLHSMLLNEKVYFRTRMLITSSNSAEQKRLLGRAEKKQHWLRHGSSGCN